MSFLFDDDIVDSYKQKVAANAKGGAQKVYLGGKGDVNMLPLDLGAKIKVRVLNWEDDTAASKRGQPWVEVWEHAHKSADGRYMSAICASTSLPKSEAFKACAACQEANRLWKLAKEGSKHDEALAKALTKSPKYFVPVYVIAHSTQPDLNGTIKILKFKKMGRKFFDWEIFGIKEDGTEPSEDELAEIVGMAGVRPKKGYDLTISVTKNKGGFHEYDYKFLNKQKGPSDLDVDLKSLDGMCREVNVNKYMEHFSADKMTKFMSVLGGDALVAETSTTHAEASEDEVVIVKPAAKPVAAAAKPVAKAAEVKSVSMDELDDLIGAPTAKPAAKAKPVDKTSALNKEIDELLAD